jgi:hypothetical protein
VISKFEKTLDKSEKKVNIIDSLDSKPKEVNETIQQEYVPEIVVEGTQPLSNSKQQPTQSS